MLVTCGCGVSNLETVSEIAADASVSASPVVRQNRQTVDPSEPETAGTYQPPYPERTNPFQIPADQTITVATENFRPDNIEILGFMTRSVGGRDVPAALVRIRESDGSDGDTRSESPNTRIVRVGDSIAGGTIATIEPPRMTISDGRGTRTLDLFASPRTSR